MLKKIYDREGISFSGMEQVIKDRNYFIHDFKVQKGASYKKEAQRLYNLINNIHSLTNQVTGVTQKVVKDNTKKQGTEKAKLIRKIDKLIKEHSSRDYLPELSYICLLLESDGCCFWKKHHAAEAFENLGYQIVPWPENNNILLIRPRSKN